MTCNTTGSTTEMLIHNGTLEKEIAAAYTALGQKNAIAGLFEKDPHLWSTEPEKVKSINNRLGWLALPSNAAELVEFANEVKQDEYKHVVLLGMGGSSLSSEVARETFHAANGYPELLVLDNTAPEAVQGIEKKIDIHRTLFIVASKSGTTAESLSFFQYFYGRAKKAGVSNMGRNFIAITDEGTPLVKIAEEHNFRKTFINPTDIGGRYSVLSNFGLLPMALMGIDIQAMLESAEELKNISRSDVPLAENPGFGLGAVLGAAEKAGRDKVTFIMSSSLQSFGYWVEQLVAESIGKEGKGLIPVTGEALGAPESYSIDRVFVHLYLLEDEHAADAAKLARLEKAGHPVVSIQVPYKLALGAEFYRWELATAVCGVLVGINPFDEPNVAEGKKNTNDLIAEWKKDGSFKKAPVKAKDGGILAYGGEGVQASSVKELLDKFTAAVRPGDYIAVLCYFEETPLRTKQLNNWRIQLRDKYKVASTFGYGPRYLHSTGQLHKGGPDSGVYIILASEGDETLEIPGDGFGFHILNEAQSLGDFRSLVNKGRRVIYIQLGKNVDKELNSLLI